MSTTIDRLDIAIYAQARNAIAEVNALYKSLNQVSQALNGIDTSKLSTGLKNVNVGVRSVGNSSRSTVPHIQKAALSLKNLLSVALGFYGIRSIFNFGKQAINLASDLAEVQNVVENSFGTKGTANIEEFVQGSIEKFGMSELAAKKTASRFQAMGNAMGITAGQVEKATAGIADRMNKDLYDTSGKAMGAMAMNLTSLAADMASFYNVEQDTAAQALNSIYTGNTRPLRQFGLDLTQATLSEWAMKRGLDANIQSMSQAEKTLLRYQYVMYNTATVQGDFARTSETWANSVRVLKQNFDVFGKTVGNVLVNVFKPLVNGLNAAMSSIIAFAETVGNALGKIFGWKILHTPASGAADAFGELSGGLDSIGDAGDGAAGGVNNATDAVKKLQRTILGFDEINKLDEASSPKSSSGGSGGSGSGGSGGGGVSADGKGADFQLVQTDKWYESYKSGINNLYQLGRYISRTLQNALGDIKWDDIYKKASNFGTGLAHFLNGLITPSLFGTLGTTIANSLNTALTALYDFGRTFNWENLGSSIAEGINRFFAHFDFNKLADTFSVWGLGVLETLKKAIGKTNWGQIGADIATFILNIKWKELFIGIGGVIGEAINAAIDFAKGLVDPQGLGNEFTSALDRIKEAAAGFMDAVDWSSLGNAISRIVSALKPAAEGFASGFASFFETLAKIGGVALNLISIAFKTLAGALEDMDPKTIEAIGKALGVIAASMTTMKLASGAIGIVQKFLGLLKIGGAGAGAGAGGFMGGAALNGLKLFKDKVSGVALEFTKGGGFVTAVAAGITTIARISDVARGGTGDFDIFTTTIEDVNRELATMGAEGFTREISDSIFNLGVQFRSGAIDAETYRNGVVDAYTKAGLSTNQLQIAFDNLYASEVPTETQLNHFNSILGSMDGNADNAASSVGGALLGAFKNIGIGADDADEKSETLKTGLGKFAGGIAANALLVAVMGKVFSNVGEDAEDAGDDISDIEDDVKGVADSFKVQAPVANKNAKEMAKDATAGMLDTFQHEQAELKKSGEMVFDVWAGGFTEAGGINSPSRVTAEYGKYLIQGLANGMINNAYLLSSKMSTLLQRITSPINTLIGQMKSKGESISRKFAEGLTSTMTAGGLFNINFSTLNIQMLNAGKTAGRLFVDGLKSIQMPKLEYYLSGFTMQKLDNKTTVKLPKYNPKWYAQGGFPNTGELFYANETGPEMIGKMGNRNVVANNRQIAEGIKAAVVDGMMEVAMAGGFGGSNGNAPYVLDVTVKTQNDEVLARAVQRGQLKRNARFNPAAQSV